MWFSKRQYEDLLLSHKREIDILTAWIEQLQAQVGAVGHSPREQQFSPPAAPTALYVADEEQDLLDAREAGLIDDIQLEEALRQAGYHNKEVVVTS